jgi:hypothetical protein
MGVSVSHPETRMTDPPEHNIVGNPRLAQSRDSAVAQGMERRTGRLRYSEPVDQWAEPAVAEIGVRQVCLRFAGKHDPLIRTTEMSLENFQCQRDLAVD